VSALGRFPPVASAGVTSGEHGRTGPGSAGPVRPRTPHPVSLRDLVRSAHRAAVDVELASGDPDTVVTGATSSSTATRPGDLFAALPGAHAHGADHAEQALAGGAAVVLTDARGAQLMGAQLIGAGAPVLLAGDPRAAVGALADEIYGRPSAAIGIAGVTGTSGKTTTTYLIRAGLASLGAASGVIGTVGAFVGPEPIASSLTTPEAADLHALLAVMRERGAGLVAMEVSSHALALSRVAGVRFAVAAFTNLSRDHLDFHPDMESYFAAKARLFDGRAAREVICIDDEWGARLARSCPAAATVSTRPGAEATWTASGATAAANGSTRFTVTGPAGSFAAGCRIPGAYNVANVLVALAVIDALGGDASAAAASVALAQVPGRMERIEAGQPFLAIVDYSHKPAALEGALRALRPLTTGRLIVVLGCGGDRDREKRQVMGAVAARAGDVLIVTDDNPRSEAPESIRAAMLAGAASVPAPERADVRESDRRRAAIHDALALAVPGDTVLIAGKGHETGQEVAGVVHPFDDRQVVRESLARLGFAASVDSAGSTGAGAAR
jgi:UDP-N-acetylmuramoyl-L-alanyl-D-glutamate--2,6-diaminopimelate ligase